MPVPSAAFLRPIPLALVLWVAASSVAGAGEVLEEDLEQGGLLRPAALAGDAVRPVLVAHESALDSTRVDLRRLVGGDGVALPAGGAIAVVARGGATRRVANPRGAPREVPDELQDLEHALSEASRHHSAIARCPWIVLIAADPSPATERLLGAVLAAGDRFQGVLLVQPYPHAEAALPESLAGLRLGVVERGTQAKPLLDAAAARGATVHHAALGTGFARGTTVDVAAFLAGPGRAPVLGRPVVPPLAEPGTWLAQQTTSADGLAMTADLYRNADPAAPVVVAAHQARSSRGEYRRIAPRLVAAGYHVLAIDQRAGDAFDGVLNDTAARAAEKELGTDFHDARSDLRRAVSWVRELGLKGPIVLLGSSYSASNALWLAPELDDVVAVAAFSPGPYVHPRYGRPFQEAMAKLEKPTLLVCPPDEAPRARELLKTIAASAKTLHVQEGGVHGASTLFRSPTFADPWNALLAFLEAHARP